MEKKEKVEVVEEIQVIEKEEIKVPRLLNAEEIDVRVGTITSKGYTLLLYKDARVDMRVLDETYGPMNWQRTHEVINDNLFCNLEIWDKEKKQWVKKQDVGTESFTEKQKGEASDSFKRAGFNWNIGRELYTSPFIWITPKNEEVEEKDGKSKIKNGVVFKVKEIEYNKNREIKKLTIVLNKYSQEAVVFEWEDFGEQQVSEEMLKIIRDKIEKLNKDETSICEYYKVEKLEDLKLEDGMKLFEMLSKKEK